MEHQEHLDGYFSFHFSSSVFFSVCRLIVCNCSKRDSCFFFKHIVFDPPTKYKKKRSFLLPRNGYWKWPMATADRDTDDDYSSGRGGGWFDCDETARDDELSWILRDGRQSLGMMGTRRRIRRENNGERDGRGKPSTRRLVDEFLRFENRGSLSSGLYVWQRDNYLYFILTDFDRQYLSVLCVCLQMLI